MLAERLQQFEQILNDSLQRLTGISEAQSEERLAPGRWSKKEILGHLIDSASNNHQRFVRAAFQEDLVFPGYKQDEWVRTQNYRDCPWADLVELWRLYNLQLARVMDATPEKLRLRKTARHNFHDIGFQKFLAGEPVTLDGLMRDYVAHLDHHLAQIPAR